MRAGVTEKNALRNTMEELEMAKVKLLGVILNAFDFKKYSYYNYRYKYYYQYGQEKEKKRGLRERIRRIFTRG